MSGKEQQQQEQQQGGRGRGKLLEAVLQALNGADDTPLTGRDLAAVLRPVIGVVNSYGQDLKEGREQLESYGGRFAKIDTEERRARNSAQYLRELENAEDKEAVQNAFNFVVAKIRANIKDKAEADEKIAEAMDNLVDECNKDKKSVLQAVIDCAKSVGYSAEAAKDKAAEAVEGTPAEGDKSGGKGAKDGKDGEDKDGKDADKPLTKEEFERESAKESADKKAAEAAKAKPAAKAESAPPRGEQTKQQKQAAADKEAEAFAAGSSANDNPNAGEVIARAKNPHDGGEGARKGELSADDLSRLAKTDTNAYKKALGF